jgi:hypothetical protein
VNASRFLSVVAERALAAGRPLHDELEAAAASATGTLPPAAERAVAFARAGKLGEALGAMAPLGFDPLLADAAALRPEAVVSVSQALAALPRPAEFTRPVLVPFVYLTAVVFFEAQVAALLSAKILPAVGDVAGATFVPLASTAGWACLVLVVAAVSALVLAPRLAAGRRLLYGSLASARVCAAFAPLAAAGVATEEAFKLAATHAPGLSEEFARAPKAALDWRELAHYFAERGAARAGRLALVVRTVGSLVAVVLAALILASVYLSLPLLSKLGGAE